MTNILGLSFGTINGKCDILTKEALYSAKEAVPEAEVRFINTICGIHGKLSIEGDKLLVDSPKEQQERARGTFRGLREHTTEIQGFGAIAGPKIMANKEFLDEKMKRIKEFDKRIAEM